MMYLLLLHETILGGISTVSDTNNLVLKILEGGLSTSI